MTKGAIFVCLGKFKQHQSMCVNGVILIILQLLKERGLSHDWKVDSAGLGGWHSGNKADSRARAVLAQHNIDYSHRARQIETEDFLVFDYIFGMDENNISGLKRDAPENSKAEILLLGDFDPEGDRIIRDPYYDSGSEGFEKCYQQCLRSCTAFLDSLEKNKL